MLNTGIFCSKPFFILGKNKYVAVAGQILSRCKPAKGVGPQSTEDQKKKKKRVGNSELGFILIKL